MDYEFTIVVPVYNEEDNLERVEKELTNYIAIASKKTKILFVNDGSKDKSQQLIEAICKRNSDFSFINFQKNCGLSAAISAGFQSVDTELVGYIDSDLQTDPDEMKNLIHSEDKAGLIDSLKSELVKLQELYDDTVSNRRVGSSR